VLERLPFFSVTGQAYKYNREETLPGVAFRGINESYTESTGVVNPQVEALYVLGGISAVDRALVQTQGNVNSLRATYDSMKAKAVSLTFTKKFFKGDSESDPNEFDGLEKRLTGDQVIDAGSTSGGEELTLAKLDETIDQVQGSPDAIFCNKVQRREISSLARAANQATEPVNDAFGRQLQAYQGIPIAIIEDDKDGNPILGFTEDDCNGDAAECTSIYAVRFGAAEYVSGLQSGQMAVIDLGLNKTKYETLVEWICGMGIFHPKAAARLRGIKKA
jgi:hypothetical protein